MVLHPLFQHILQAHGAPSPKPDPRDPDHSRAGMFVYHNCWKCQSGEKPCVNGNPGRCEFPHARND